MEKRLLNVLAALLLFCSCHNRTHNHYGSDIPDRADLVEVDIVYADPKEGDTIRHARMKYYDFDTVKDLTGFFDALSARYPIVKWLSKDDNIDEVVHDCIAQIDSYRKRERLWFPDSLVNHCISYMGFNIAATNNHSPNQADLVLAEWVMMCAAYYSPDITCLVETQTPDHCTGFYNFGISYNPLPWWPYLFFKREKGYEVRFLGDQLKICSVFQLYDDHDRKYYLFSNNRSAYEFNQWLYLADDNTLPIMVAECHEVPVVGDIETTHFDFNKNEQIWKYAIKDKTDGKLKAANGDIALSLILDGKKSRFLY